MNRFRPVYNNNCKILCSIAVEVPGCSIGLIVSDRAPDTTVAGLHLFNVFGAITVFLCCSSKLSMFRKPISKNLLVS